MLKIGFWQILEALSIFYSLANSFYKNGKQAITQKKHDAYMNLSDDIKAFSAVLIFCMFFALGPMIAYFGGCTGIYFTLYCILCFVMYMYGMILMHTGAAVNKKFSFIQTLGLSTAYTVLLYLGGFWTN